MESAKANPRLAIYRFEVRDRGPGGPRAAALEAEARALGLGELGRVRRADLYFVEGTIAPEELELLGRFLFSDPVTQECRWSRVGERAAKRGGASGQDAGGAGPAVEVAPRPGVTDPVASEILRAARELGVPGLERAATGTRYEFEGLSEEELELVARRLLANPVIHRWKAGEIEPSFPEEAARSAAVEPIPVHLMSDSELEALSRSRRAALDLDEMRAIKAYFRAEGRPCTDLEFEALAQTWSEHCVHKTFKALVEVEAPRPHPYPDLVDGVLSTYIRSATEEIAAPWVLSAFVDNAGIIEFDEHFEVSFKVETHNHPSAIEPFGGANTGVGGVIRDIMGVSARPIAATDVLCFGPPGTAGSARPEGVLHPRLVASGVVAGVQDYGNKMGVPTVNGGVRYHEGYAANPLVYCGCVGLAPRGLHRRSPARGDRVVVLGGRTGRDGIRGATFSSMAMDASTGDVAGASVQIGDPVVEKKVLDVLLEARDARLYDAVTDCGAGGLSSAVGEMASEFGADLDLDRVRVKYPGLAAWEVWLSEAQERMVLAVPPASLAALAALCETNDVELSDLGEFTGTGRLAARSAGQLVLDLDCAFLHGGLPRRRLRASPPAPGPGEPAAAGPSGAEPRGSAPGADRGSSSDAMAAPAEILLRLLAHPNIASKEPIVRLYDHEVQGGTCVKPFCGPKGDAPSDAAVLKPQGTGGSRAIALSNGFCPEYGELDPYRMAWSAIDEALRNAVAVGADPDRLAILDNFCLGDPRRPETMWCLLEAARGCRDASIAHCAPFISGKDSFNNEYLSPDAERTSIPPSLLISAIAIVPELERAVTSFLKEPGDPIYLVGEFRPTLAGSHWSLLRGAPSASGAALTSGAGFGERGSGFGAGGEDLEHGPPAPSTLAPRLYRALHGAIKSGAVRACHDLSEGGLAVALAEMCMGGRLGSRLSLEPAARLAGCGEESDAGPIGAAGAIGASSAAAPLPDRLLFGETNGCLLVELDPGRAADFEAALEGLPFACLGETSAEPRLAFLKEGRTVLDLGLDELLGAWKGGA